MGNMVRRSQSGKPKRLNLWPLLLLLLLMLGIGWGGWRLWPQFQLERSGQQPKVEADTSIEIVPNE